MRHTRNFLPEAPDPVKGFSALCSARWQGPEKAGHARIALAYLAPDQIRLEVLDPAGNSRAVLVATEEGALVLDPARRSYRVYPSGLAAASALIGIAAPPQLLGRLLLGPLSLAPTAACLSGADAKGDDPGPCTLPDGAVLILPKQERDKGQLSLADGARLELRWGGGSSGGRSLPRWLEIRQGIPEALLRLETREVGFSMPDASLFSLRTPAGFIAETSGSLP